jgi:hypothetical protein
MHAVISPRAQGWVYLAPGFTTKPRLPRALREVIKGPSKLQFTRFFKREVGAIARAAILADPRDGFHGAAGPAISRRLAGSFALRGSYVKQH